MRLIKTLLVIAATAFASAGHAVTIDFEFSFENLAKGGGTVTGIVRGLEDNATSGATSLEITSNTAGFGVGEYIGTPSFNTWTVVNGVLTAFDFVSFGVAGTAPQEVTDSSIRMTSLLRGVGLTNEPNLVRSSDETLETLVFTQVAPVPLPASLPLALIGLLGLVGIARRRRSATA